MFDPDLSRNVTSAIHRALELATPLSALRLDTSLVELGMDSLNAIDLAVALEEALGIAEFPIQEWADAEAAREEPRFTVGALIRQCVALLEDRPRLEAGHDR